MDFIFAEITELTNNVAGTKMSINEWGALIRDLGLAAGLVLFFVFKNDKRETKYETRIQALEDFQRTTLIELVKEHTTLLAQNTEVLNHCITVLEAHKKNHSNV